MALLYFFSIIAAGAATCTSLALLLLKFLSASLLVDMGNTCNGVFAFGHGFLAASRLNYLFALGLATVFLFQLAFLLGGATRLIHASYRLGKKRVSGGARCPALPLISGKPWTSKVYITPEAGIDAQTTGLLLSKIHISPVLVRRLPRNELMAVISHERAHCSGKDNFLMAAARAVSLAMFYLPGQRMACREMRLCLEKAADQKAASQTGGPLAIARALARIASSRRSTGQGLPAAMHASGGEDVTSRLQALARDGGEKGRRRPRLCLFLLLAAASVCFFASSAFAATGADQRQAFICYVNHQQGGGKICKPDHSQP